MPAGPRSNGGQRSACRPIESRKKAVAQTLNLIAAETDELPTDNVVMRTEQHFPTAALPTGDHAVDGQNPQTLPVGTRSVAQHAGGTAPASATSDAGFSPVGFVAALGLTILAYVSAQTFKPA